jgi:hypothetical protein
MNLDSTTRTIAGRPIRSCSSCGALIVWFKTEAGKAHPVDATSVKAQDLNLDLQTKKNPAGKHMSHFATCPNADKHRKPR